MNRVIVIVAGIGLVLFGVVVAILNVVNNQSPEQTNGPNGTNAYQRIDACDILTKKVVTEMYGGEISGTIPVKGSSANTELLVTTCSLTSTTGNTDNGTAMLLARVALNEIGAGSNLQGFDSNKPPESVDVDDVGDRAYYVPSFNQLNVIKGNNWYILSTYTKDVLDGSLEDVKKMAAKLNFQ